MERKKPGRRAEEASERRIAWPRWTGFRGKTGWDCFDDHRPVGGLGEVRSLAHSGELDRLVRGEV